MRFKIWPGVLTVVLGAGMAPGAVSAAAAVAAPAVGGRPGAGAVTNLRFGLDAVSVLSSSDAWAVGGSATVLHWNGVSWAPVTIGGLPASVTITAVDALSGSDVWAAGIADAGTPFSPQTTLLAHWDGTAWTRVPSPGSYSSPQLPASRPG